MDESVRRINRVIVIGGGLTGLAAAHRLTTRAQATQPQRPLDVLLLEAGERLGGAIRTEHRDGFTLESGADSFITNKPWALELCDELGLTDRLIGTDSRYRRSFVVHRGRLAPVPEGFMLMAPGRLRPLLATPILSIPGKLRILLELLLPRRTEETDESLAAFVRRRFGREALDRLVQPLIGGIYTADPNELSLRATMPRFIAMEQEHRSLILAMRRQSREDRSQAKAASGARYSLFNTIDEGMEALPKALAAAIPNGSTQLQAPVRRLVRAEPQAPWRVEMLDGSSLEAEAVIVATEAHAAARLLDSLDPELAAQLRSIPYASTAIANVALRRQDIAHPLNGFGAVVPIIEHRQILAISFTSVKFPNRSPSDTALLRVFLGGATQPELFDREDSDLESIVRRELVELLGVRGEPLFLEFARHARGMPQYTLGHLDRVAEIQRLQTQHAGLALAGNAFAGVGIPDCIRSGREAADAILDELNSASQIAAA